jgi:hypothetical protein
MRQALEIADARLDRAGLFRRERPCAPAIRRLAALASLPIVISPMVDSVVGYRV